jgi:hypothetical protein
LSQGAFVCDWPFVKAKQETDMSGFVTPKKLQRHRAFLAMAPADRPLVGSNLFGLFLNEQYPNFSRPIPEGRLVTPDDIRADLFLEDCEEHFQSYLALDGDYPYIEGACAYVPWMEAIMGCPIRATATSMWAEPVIDDWHAWTWERPNLGKNAWALKLLELLDAVVDHSAGRYPVAPTLLRGPFDMLSALRGPAVLPLDMYDYPSEVRRAAALCTDVWIEVAKAQIARVPDSPHGYFAAPHGLKFWAPERVIWLQEDVASLLSPRFYRDFVQPADRQIAAQFPWTGFHVHGTCCWVAEQLLDVPEVAVIELNHDADESGEEKVFSACKKIQGHKPLVIWRDYRKEGFWPWLERILDELSPRGLSIQVHVATLDEALAIKERVEQVKK